MKRRLYARSYIGVKNRSLKRERREIDYGMIPPSGRSVAWLARHVWDVEIVSSNLTGPTILSSSNTTAAIATDTPKYSRSFLTTDTGLFRTRFGRRLLFLRKKLNLPLRTRLKGLSTDGTVLGGFRVGRLTKRATDEFHKHFDRLGIFPALIPL